MRIHILSQSGDDGTWAVSISFETLEAPYMNECL